MASAGNVLKLRACDRCAAIKQVCDRESRESCSRCTRLELPCAITRVHKPMGRPRKASTASTSPHVTPSVDNQPPPPPPPPSSPTALSPDKNKAQTERPPRPACRIKRVQRTRSGCATCKQRRKKCDEAHPVCGDCNRLGLVCQRAPPPPPPRLSGPAPARRSSVSSTSSTSSDSGSSTCSTVSRRPSFRTAAPVADNLLNPLSLYTGCTSQEQHLLQHYTHVVSRSLSVVPDEINSFISLFVPMAIQQPALRSALLGLSATHLKRLHSSFDVTAVEHQNRALKQANQLLTQGTDAAAMEGLAAVLFLCLQEICEGKSRKWPLHLEAAVTIINARGGPACYPDSVRFLIETVAYFDAIATLSSGRSAFLDQQFYVPAAAAAAASPHATLPAHALFGTAHALFAIIADISQLAQLRGARHGSPLAERSFRAVAADLELQLQRWAPAACSSAPAADPHLERKVTAAAVALQWAALMRLHLVVAEPPGDLAHPKVRVAVAHILAALAAIPHGDLVESMLVFPVFAAGFGALLPEEREQVDVRFAVMERSIGFGNVFDAHEAVRAHWARMDAGVYDGRDVSWEEVVGGVGGTLIMS